MDKKDRIVDAVVARYQDRAKKGLVKYGTTMDRDDLTIRDWLQHLQEELMDATVYLEKLKQEVEYTEDMLADKQVIHRPSLEFRAPCVGHNAASEEYEEELHPKHLDNPFPDDWDEFIAEERMNIIGQNGNTGEHYDKTRSSVEVAVDKSNPCGWDNTNVSTSSGADSDGVFACGECDYYCIGGCKKGNI